MDFMSNGTVAVIQTHCFGYPDKANLFRPDRSYPEYPHGTDCISPVKNGIYAAVRKSFYFMGLDKENYGTKEWNPLKDFIKPGDSVLIKPNLVMDHNPCGAGTDCLYTHPSVVAPVIDYILIALRGSGTITIGDAPVQDCKFEKLIDESGYKALVNWYTKKGYDIHLVDFRELTAKVSGGIHIQEINTRAKGTVIDLGGSSEFADADPESFDKMRITNYDPDLLQLHHSPRKHEYYVSDYLLSADCVINMPKPKAHRKAGVTISLKNMVGMNVRKEYLPHHTMGSSQESGDEYEQKNSLMSLRSKLWDKRNHCSAQGKEASARMYNLFNHLCSAILQISGASHYSEGSWWGNHTISRTIADLNKILYYADKNGVMQPVPQRKILILADMIISGEKEGPLLPTPKQTGMIVAGINPVCFDEAVTTLMGFDIRQIPTLSTARNIKGNYKLVEADTQPVFYSNVSEWNKKTISSVDKATLFHFIPTEGWKGHIEIGM